MLTTLYAYVKETRHEIDAEVAVNVTAHQVAVVKECPLHGGVKAGTFPDDTKVTVQYAKTCRLWSLHSIR